MICIYSLKKGFTLLETIVAFGVFSVFSVVIWQFVYFGSQNAARILVENELLEQSRIAMEFMTGHLKQSDCFYVVKENGVFKELHVENNGEKRGFYFRHNGSQKILYFGGETAWGNQELASCIKEINIDTVNGKMYIQIRSEDNIGTSVTAEPVVLRSVVDLRYMKDLKD